MQAPTLNPEDVRETYGDDAYRKGLSYKNAGAVTSLRWIGDTLEARVQGSRYEPYVVKIAFLGDRPARATCTCPIGAGCKHIVATLLEWSQAPDDVEEQPDLPASLAPLDRNQIESILMALAERNSDLYDDIVLQINLAKAKSLATDATALSPEPFQVAARAAFREASRVSYDDYYGEEADDEEARNLLFPLIEELEQLVKTGNATTALPALEAITVEFSKAEGRLYDEDENESEGFLEEVSVALNDLWLHTALTVDLSREERLEWSRKLAQWSKNTSDDELFENAREALAHSWDDPVLIHMLSTGEAGPEADDWEAEEVYDKRIAVLQEQGRVREMLNLALAVGNHAAASLAYVSLVQPVEAANHAIAHLTESHDILSVCQALQSAGALDEALRLGEHGLSRPKPTEWYFSGAAPRLSVWIRDVARNAGKPDLELRAAECAFGEIPSLADYERIGVLSGDRWLEKKEKLLSRLYERNTSADVAVDILLREERWDDALKIADKSYGITLERTVRAALTHVPDRAIDIAKRQAEPIMDFAKASHYESAAQWLGYARAAYKSVGRLNEWDEYLQGLLNTHARKYKLVPLLRKLA